MYMIAKSVVWRSVGDTVFVYSPDGSHIHKFNDLGQLIWLAVAEKPTEGINLEALTALVRETYEVDAGEASRDISGFLADLVGKGLVQQT